MNVAIWVSAEGQRSRSRPRIRSRTVVVPTISSEASTPRVAWARMFQPPSRPSTDSDRPATLTRSPAARKGSANARATNGSSMVARRASRVGSGRWWRPPPPGRRTPRRPSTPPGGSSRPPRSTPPPPRSSPRGAAGGPATRPAGTAGACRARRPRRLLRGRCGVPVAAPGAHGRGATPTYQPEQAAADREGDEHPDQPRQAGAERLVVEAADPVVGEHAVGQVMVPFRLSHAGAAGDLAASVHSAALSGAVLQPGRAVGGEHAHHARQRQAHNRARREEPAVPPHAAPPVAGTGAAAGRAPRNA